MKNWLPFLALTLCAELAVAEPPAAAPAAAPTQTQSEASALVEKKLLEPLKKAEAKRSRFSRAAPVPVARRVRVLDAVARTDTRGKAFVRFAVDVRRRGTEEGDWVRDAMLGCAYPKEQKVFVQRNDVYVPARSVLGEDAEPKPNVCRAAPSDDAPLATTTSTRS